jgi:hypothetical protein
LLSMRCGTMADILIRCAIYGRPVKTGLTTETIVFESLSELEIPLNCPACLKIHKWGVNDAWIDKGALKDPIRQRK